jgi:hypothetical protein
MQAVAAAAAWPSGWASARELLGPPSGRPGLHVASVLKSSTQTTLRARKLLRTLRRTLREGTGEPHDSNPDRAYTPC